ncbi:hypothetical protein LSUB1_G003760 [Lachnellula subtilissima]|uniref:AB hydrolase-1 domain-containing protein n=1 Tax=Lachnellula subtilissima TaxID=602034 RepID=A0A8H8RLN5_9HELO|nr:hypothetical protein LSUB1_G003760 [Lachnellula subtilissima]
MSGKPTLIFIHGSWHHTDTWNKVAPLLEAQQFKCVRVALPSGASDPSLGLPEDVKAVRDAIMTETSQGHNVVVVVHSYGGLVGSSAVKGLTRNKEDGSSPAKGTSGHVIGMAMIATGFAQTGLCFMEGLGGITPPAWKFNQQTGFVDLVDDPRELFYHDLCVEEGDYWVSRLTKQSTKALVEGGESVYSGWKDTPVWYLSTEQDHGLPFEAQKFFVQSAKEAGGDITVREIDTSHSPMLSKPEETVAFIVDAVKAFEG